MKKYNLGFVTDKDIYEKHNYRKITKSEACRRQGFPDDFLLPPTRQRWMKLIGNSVAVPTIKILAKSIIDTGVFANNKDLTYEEKNKMKTAMQQYSLENSYQKQGIQTDLF